MNLEIIKAASYHQALRSMAIIKGVRFGVRDDGQIGLSFGAYIAEGIGAPQFLPEKLALNVIFVYDVADVSRLEGRPCWVTIKDGICTFESPCLL